MIKITDLTTSLLQIPSAQPLGDATATWNLLGGCFAHIRTNAGLEGLGWSGASSAIREVIEHNLKPIIVGSDPLEIERLWDRMFSSVRSIGRKGAALCAISAVDIALWDLKAKMLGLPLYKLLGPYTDSVPVYGSGGWTTLSDAELVNEMAGYVQRGFTHVKMKVGRNFGSCEADDIRRLALVRKALGADVGIYVDANGGYRAKQAISIAKRFEEYGVSLFEEPVIADDIEGLSVIAKSTTIPIAAGENEYTKYGFKDLIARGGVDVVQPDVGRVGGVTEWLKVAHLAEAFNLPVAPHAMQLVHLHLACATPNLMKVEVIGVQEDYSRELFQEIPPHNGGMWAPFPDKPGLGVELRQDAVARFAR
jgi:L-alanine-DL-glutamate epimerase-like enolase superfamily enzyme